MKVVFDGCSLENQIKFHALLPMRHEFGDVCTVLNDGKVLTADEHEAYCPYELRKKCRKRVYVFDKLCVTHTGGYGFHSRKKEVSPFDISAVFLPTIDFHGQDSAEFILENGPGSEWPKLQHNTLLPHVYFETLYRDIFYALRVVQEKFTNVHLKIVPLGYSHGLTTKAGDPLFILWEFYVLALKLACERVLDASWVKTVEFVDSTMTMCPNVQLPGVRIIHFSRRDILNFGAMPDSGTSGRPVILVPVDSFSLLGQSGLSLSLIHI